MTVSRPHTPQTAVVAEAAAGSRPITPASKVAHADGARPATPKDAAAEAKPASRAGSTANIGGGSKVASAANIAAVVAAEHKAASRTGSSANVAAEARPITPAASASRPGSANTADRHLHASPAAAAFWKEKFGSDIGRVALPNFVAELSVHFAIPLDVLEANTSKLPINTKATGHVTVIEFAQLVHGAEDIKEKVLALIQHAAEHAHPPAAEGGDAAAHH